MTEPRTTGEQGVPPDQSFLAFHAIDSLTADVGRLFVVVGVFDGIHRGHQYLIRQLRALARQRDARPAVITFDAHPREIITGAAPPQLCDADERLVRLAAAGVEILVVQHFDARLRETSYEGFVTMIQDRVELAGFLMTPDAAFGYQRRGTPEALAALGERRGFEVAVVPPLTLGGRSVSSSEIRAAVADGDLAKARYLMGRTLSVVGERAARADRGAPSGDGLGSPERLTFPLPVAMPPAGRYGVAIGRPWALGALAESASIRAVATVTTDPQAIELRSTGSIPSTSRLRVAFQRRLAPAARSGAVPGSFAGSGQA